MKYQINTPYGNSYIIHENGNIERTDMKFTPSGQWKFLGLESVKSREFIPFPACFKANLQMRYKNGNPRYTVRDLDHGTTRTWGNTKYHGVTSFHCI